MSPLPRSVRLSLWGTRVLTGDLPSAAVDRLIAPDLDDAATVRPHLEMWQTFGERVVLVALPHPGHFGGMPAGPSELSTAAVTAGECVYVPTLGGALVPVDAGDGPMDAGPWPAGVARGPQTTWQRFDSEPVEPWRLDVLSVREVARRFAEDSASAVGVLSAAHRPWSSRGLRAVADAALDTGDLGIPTGLPTAATKLIADAAAAGQAARIGLTMPDDGTLSEVELRSIALRRLLIVADQALAAATCIAALHLAGMRDDRRDDW